jgi:uncharacterized repeat protein (TIGR03803 family)
VKRSEQHWSLTRFRRFVAAGFFILLATAVAARAQTFTVLYSFGNGSGSAPFAGVTLDQRGAIYGTTAEGGAGCGTVFRLSHSGGGWVINTIHTFHGGTADGCYPYARVVFGPDGLLYGTTNYGGANNSGTVFSLRPPPSVCRAVLCPWIETVLDSFTGGRDGAYPYYGDLSFDQAGSIYGTTEMGGARNGGAVFKLTPSGSGWTESVLWSFTGEADGDQPISGVIFDNAGNLYGTTSNGNDLTEFGTVYELSPSQSGWTETTLYDFTDGDNGSGSGGLVMDSNGNLFGFTGDFSPGAAYELTPSNGSWTFTVLQVFEGGDGGPVDSPTLDSQGNLYGSLPTGGNDYGEIFKLTPSGDEWIYTPLFDFNGSNGSFPMGGVTLDGNGNLYGTTPVPGNGTVWEITP